VNPEKSCESCQKTGPVFPGFLFSCLGDPRICLGGWAGLRESGWDRNDLKRQLEKTMSKQRIGMVCGLCLLGLLATGARGQEREDYPIASLTNNVALEVDWQDEFAYGVSAGANGSVEGTASGWLDGGTAISNSATADEHYQFAGWENGPAGQELDNPLLFALDGPYTNVTATFALTNYTVGIASTHPWFGTETIGNPAGAGSYPAFSTVTASVDRIVLDPENPGRRLRVKEIRVVE